MGGVAFAATLKTRFYTSFRPYLFMGVLDGLRESAAAFYSSLEEKYYSLMDWLQEKGAHAYDWFVNPLEDRGIPSLPVAALLVIAVLCGLFLVLATQAGVSLQVNAASGGAPLAGAKVTVFAADKEFSAVTDSSGTARFDNLPRGGNALVRVEKEGFEKKSQELLLTPEAGATVAISVELSSQAKPRIAVYVSDSRNAPLGNASIAFVDPTTGRVREVATDATGAAYIEFSDENEIFNLRVSRDGFVSERLTCFASQPECLVKLSSESGTPVGEGGTQEREGGVFVLVKDESGKLGLEARVTLMDADSSNELSVDSTSADGSARFNGVAAGLRVYVIVEPSDPQYLSYNGGLANDYQVVSPSRDAEFRVQLRKKTAGDTKQIRLSVTDPAGDPVELASVKLYSSDNPLVLLDASETDAAGEAVFEVLSNTAAYATIWADGFLPHLEKSIAAGDSKTIALEALVAGNNGAARVTVLDADGGRVEFARVSLATADGFASGAPEQETGEDGSAEFEGLPLEDLRAYATKGSSHGVGDAFTVSYTTKAEAVVALEPTYGFIQAHAVDASQREEKAVSARIEALVDGKSVANCTTPSGNATTAYCTLKVRANKPVILKATLLDIPVITLKASWFQLTRP